MLKFSLEPNYLYIQRSSEQSDFERVIIKETQSYLVQNKKRFPKPVTYKSMLAKKPKSPINFNVLEMSLPQAQFILSKIWCCKI